MADLSSILDIMRERTDTLSTLGHRVRFELTDTGESILLDATGPQAEFSTQGGEAEAVLKLTTDTLDKLITGRMGPMLAYSTGRLKVEGSQGVALKLAGLFDE